MPLATYIFSGLPEVKLFWVLAHFNASANCGMAFAQESPVPVPPDTAVLTYRILLASVVIDVWFSNAPISIMPPPAYSYTLGLPAKSLVSAFNPVNNALLPALIAGLPVCKVKSPPAALVNNGSADSIFATLLGFIPSEASLVRQFLDII